LQVTFTLVQLWSVVGEGVEFALAPTHISDTGHSQ